LRPIRDIATAINLWRVMRRVRPDVVHTHKAKAGAIGRAVAFLSGVRVIVHTYHGHYFRGYFGRAKTRAFLAIERGLARTTDHFVTLTQSLVEQLSVQYRIAPAERFSVVSLGFDLRPFAAADQHRAELRRTLGLSSKDGMRLVGIVGR